MTTPKGITYIVVGTLSALSVTYMFTLSYCTIAGVTPNDAVDRAFQAAGMYILGAFTGLLVNTRSQQPETQDAQSDSSSNNLRPAPHPNTDTDAITITHSRPNGPHPDAVADSDPKSHSTSISATSSS